MARLTNGNINGKLVTAPTTTSGVGKWNTHDQHLYRFQNIWQLQEQFIPTYFAGTSIAINGGTYLYQAFDGSSGPSPCTSSPSSQFFIDLRGINVQSIEVIFDAAWYNSQPSLNVLSGNYTVTTATSTTNIGIAGSTTVASENLYTTYGNLATGEIINVTRTYSYGAGRTDLGYFMAIGSCQAVGSRYLKIRSFKINGKSIASLTSSSYSTTSRW